MNGDTVPVLVATWLPSTYMTWWPPVEVRTTLCQLPSLYAAVDCIGSPLAAKPPCSWPDEPMYSSGRNSPVVVALVTGSADSDARTPPVAVVLNHSETLIAAASSARLAGTCTKELVPSKPAALTELGTPASGLAWM